MPPFSLAVGASAFTRPPRHRYAAHRDGVGDLHVPAADGPHPVAVVLHGGYWRTTYGRLTTRPLAADLARRGWAAWNVEYGRIGHRGRGGWPQTFTDVAAAIDHLATLADPRLDLDRVVAVGHSAGGQLALWAGGRVSLPPGAPGADPVVRVRRVLALAPVTDMARAGTTAALLLGGSVDEVPERFAQADPVRRAPLDVPVTIVHPRGDATIPVRRSEAYAQRAAAAGADVELVTPDEGGHVDVIVPRHSAWEAAAQRLEALPAR